MRAMRPGRFDAYRRGPGRWVLDRYQPRTVFNLRSVLKIRRQARVGMVPQIHSEIEMKPRHRSTPSSMATVAEVARYLHVQPMTIYRLIRKGQIPALKIGAEYRFDMDQLKKWIANHEVKD